MSVRWTRWLLVSLIVAAVLAYWASGAGQHLSLADLHAHLEQLHAFEAGHPLLLALLFGLIYLAFAALALPGAIWLTLAAGALFGVVEGTLLVSFASSIGAALAFLASRFLLRDWVHKRFGVHMRAIDAGVQRDGALYLFALRLTPVFPFFLVNLAMGLTSVGVGTFYLISQIGMLPATLLYVNAGTRLAGLDSLRGLVSPAVLISLSLLGVFPLIMRLLLRALARRRVYRRWPKPRRFDRNLVVIGGGAAGLVSAYIAAAVRAKVTLVEQARMGGDCLNSGCVPSKALIHIARLAAQQRRAQPFGADGNAPRIDSPRALARVHAAVAAVAPHDSVERYRNLGVDVRQSHARIVSPWCVEVDGQPISTRAIVIAAGAEPRVPDLPGLREAGYLTSDTLWDLTALPDSLIVLGGGPIGCELAQALARLGVQVTLVEPTPRLLGREDEEVSALVQSRLLADGVRVLTAHQPLAVRVHAGQRLLRCAQAPGEIELVATQILVAVGRQARVSGYGLEELGIGLSEAGTIASDAFMATRFPNIYVCGDVAGPYQFTHMSAHQAWYASVNALFGALRRFSADYRVVPTVTFVDPEVARVGLSEREAQAQGIAFEVTRYEMRELDRAIVEDETEGFIKVLTVPGKDRILGATIVSAHAGELLAEFTLAMRHGLGLNKILATIHAYPTWAEANKLVAGAWRQAHAPQRARRWLERYHRWRRRGGEPDPQSNNTPQPTREDVSA